MKPHTTQHSTAQPDAPASRAGVVRRRAAGGEARGEGGPCVVVDLSFRLRWGRKEEEISRLPTGWAGSWAGRQADTGGEFVFMHLPGSNRMGRKIEGICMPCRLYMSLTPSMMMHACMPLKVCGHLISSHLISSHLSSAQLTRVSPLYTNVLRTYILYNPATHSYRLFWLSPHSFPQAT